MNRLSQDNGPFCDCTTRRAQDIRSDTYNLPAETPAGLETNLLLQPGLVSQITIIGQQTTGFLSAFWGTLWYGLSHVTH
jgi:hypothetical protein